jgi:hypothetical protein
VPTEDSFAPEHSLPLFLSDRAVEHEPRGSSRFLRASIAVIAATVSGIAITLSLENPAKVVADVTASLAEMSGLKPGAETLPPTVRSATTRDETAATLESADQGQTEINEPPSGVLLKQFQAWAASEHARPQAEAGQPVQNAQAQAEPVQPAQNARAQILEDDPAPVRRIQKYRRVRPVQTARAEIRPLRHPRARGPRHQNARVEVRPVQDARAQAQPVQNPQPPSFLQSLGWQ